MNNFFKRAVSSSTVLAMVLGLSVFSLAKGGEKGGCFEKPKIAVISDIHYFSPKLGTSGAEFDKYLAYDRKMLAQSDAIFKKAIETIKASDANIVLVTGDLTKDGEKLDHKIVADYFAKLEDAGKKVYVINGNHDINNPESVKYVGDSKESVDNVSPKEFKKIYKDFGYKEAIAQDPNSLSYVVEPYKGFRIIAMDSCLYDNNQGLEHPVTAGAFSKSRMDWIENQVKDAKAKNITIIGMMHHGILQHWGMQETLMGEYLLTDWRNISTQLADLGLEVVFTGHAHSQDVVQNITAKGNSLTDIETGSLITYPSPYRMVEFDENNSLKVNSYFIDSISYNLNNVPFQDFSQNYLATGYYQQIPQLFAQILAGKGYTPEEIAPILYNLSTQQIVPGATALDLLVQAMVMNHKGDETISADLACFYSLMCLSEYTPTVLLGRTLSALSIDLSPMDNDVLITLH